MQGNAQATAMLRQEGEMDASPNQVSEVATRSKTLRIRERKAAPHDRHAALVEIPEWLFVTLAGHSGADQLSNVIALLYRHLRHARQMACHSG